MSTRTDLELTPAVPDDDAPSYDDLLPGEAEGLAEFEEQERANAPETALDGLDGENPDPEAEAPEPEQEPEPEPEPEKAAAGLERETAPEPTPRIDLTEDLKNARTALDEANSKLAEVKDQWDNGEIGQEEYERAFREAESAQFDAAAEYNSLKTLEKAQSMTERQEAQRRQAEADREWNDVQSRFVENNPALASRDHIDGFNEHVRLYTQPNGPYAALGFEKQLDLAMQSYRTVLEASGKTPPEMKLFGGENPPAKAPADPKAEERARTARQMQEPPVTLRDVPNDAMDPHQSLAAKWAARIENETDPDRLDELYSMIPPEIEDRVLQYGAG